MCFSCVLTIGVLKKFKDKTGKELQEVKDVFSICTLLFMAATASCRKERVTFPWDSAEALMDDIELSEIEAIANGLFGAGPSSQENEKNGVVEIDRVIGICVGVIGLSLSDAYRLTLDEFTILYEEWDAYRTASFRTSWEQTRFLAHCSLLPYAKRTLRPADLIAFEWEREQTPEAKPVTRQDFERMEKQFRDE